MNANQAHQLSELARELKLAEQAGTEEARKAWESVLACIQQAISIGLYYCSWDCPAPFYELITRRLKRLGYSVMSIENGMTHISW